MLADNSIYETELPASYVLVHNSSRYRKPGYRTPSYPIARISICDIGEKLSARAQLERL